MNRSGFLLCTALVGLLSLGCYTGNVQPLGAVGEHMGEATESARSQQVANPEAGGTEPVMGMDGQTSHGVAENYRYNEKAQTQDRKLRDQSVIKLGN